MRRALTVVLLLVASRVHADEQRARGEVGGGLGWAFPAGSLERGARTSDETFGVVAASFDAALRIDPRFSIGLVFQYGIVTPKLCASSSDCTGSLGRDVALGALLRWHVARVSVFRPSVAASLGYEWFSSKLRDGDATSTRGHRGVLFGLDAFGAIALAPRVFFGPTVGFGFGVADHASLDAPGVSASGAVDGHALHVWPRVAARFAMSW